MKSIYVLPSHLEGVAKSVDSNNQEYQRLFKKLYSDVDNISAVWQGEDNLAFVNQIKGFLDDFNRMSQIMNQYSDFLRNSARSYRDCQSQLVQQVKSLTN